jgi:hypothetical protein
VFGERHLQGGDGIEHGRADGARQGFDERRVGATEYVVGVRADDCINLLLEKIRLEKSFRNRFLRDEFFADGAPNGFGEACAVARIMPSGKTVKPKILTGRRGRNSIRTASHAATYP